MKRYFRNMVYRLLCIITILSCIYGFICFDVNHYDVDSDIFVAKVENDSKEDKSNLDEIVDIPLNNEEINVEVVKEVETVHENDVIPVVEGNSIKIEGSFYLKLMKDETGENFYLNHDEFGNYNGVGVPYIDFRNDFSTRKTIIYAHSSPNGNGPFQSLQNFHNNKTYYDAHRFIEINYNGVQYKYEIFSVYVSIADSEEDEGLEYFHRMDYEDSEWEVTIQKYKNNSEYDTGVLVNANDKIIILQTCSMDPNYYNKYYRYNLLIIGKLV